MNHNALVAFLDDLGLATLAPLLSSESLQSLIIRLEDRPGLLLRLKEAGIALLPQRQKIANGLAKCKRAALSRRGLEMSSDNAVTPTGTAAAQAIRAGTDAQRSLIPLPRLSSLYLEAVSDLSGFLMTADGQVVALNGPLPLLGALVSPRAH